MKNLFIGNIPEDISEAELSRTLNTQAMIAKVGIFKDKYTDRSLGFGYLTIDEKSEQEIKSKLNGFDLNGSKIVLN
ncbi:MAG: hypothetical protein DKM50_09375 [Candidatus Margulisiibacteriota bacterium]|nr:MAG: hypothetical protein A2X43_02265 [Candidatus Margulisbacteria bacterium GWD2_39_127]OGI00899.1 MAG: hypothetical protein A2X42_03140 [Candidatus Margulisbacteria bacterium GWF2_38_17]OGI08754.1 MAG: hypothetical protein A2X41_05395 [Candidatus Margulisbacteria bacterium GWE2_39_32]PZM79465.1 MAG: hypothetical protein DKM50_09375 [Candidatus Margulisiibacteriota bacterium]HAR63481.1 hypothetical protein [Candidatus Margulisiibacteriota bacterium]